MKRCHCRRRQVGKGERRQPVIGVSGTVTKIWTPPSKRKEFIPTDENEFRMYVTRAPVLVNDSWVRL